jgi:hypothetical protein
VERDVAFVPFAFAEIGDGIFRPLIGLGEEHSITVFSVDVITQFFEEGVSFRKTLAGSSFAFVEVRNGVEAHSVHADVTPEIENTNDLGVDFRIVEIDVGLVKEKAMPVIGVCDRVPSPV